MVGKNAKGDSYRSSHVVLGYFNIIKAYDKKISLEQNKKERQEANNQTKTKKESLKTLFILKNSFCILYNRFLKTSNPFYCYHLKNNSIFIVII